MLLFWRDGLVSEETIHPFDLTDRGLLLGDGLFDTALVVNGHIHREAAHHARLLAGLRDIGIAIAPEKISEIYHALAAASVAKGIKQAALRLTVTRGSGPRGLGLPPELRPQLFASLAPLPILFTFAPITLHVSTIRRNETSPLSRFKTASSLDAVLAHDEAVKAGCDEALFLNMAGRVACAASGNLFALLNGRIITPRRDEGILPGCLRALLLAESKRIGMEIMETEMQWEHLLTAEAVFMTNSLRLLAPVSRINIVSFTSASHPAVLALQDFLQRQVQHECGMTSQDV